jgi:hypothetical protein
LEVPVLPRIGKSLSGAIVILATCAIMAASPARALPSRAVFAFSSLGVPTVELNLNGAITVAAQDMGWYDQTGSHDSTNENYIVGLCGSSDVCRGNDSVTRNFFVFAIPAGLVVNAATLRVEVASPNGYISPNATEVYDLFDVLTFPSVLTAGGSGLTGIYDDLGTGASYGSRVMSNADEGNVVEIGLNAAALGDINEFAGSLFAIGGALRMNAQPIPEPATLALAALGLLGLASILRRRR